MNDRTQQIVEQVSDAAAAGRPLALCGAGSKAFYGRAIEGDPLSVADHEGVVDYHPRELVMTARAGTSLAAIDAALAEHGQYLPADPPRFGGAGTLGGSLACNLSGPGRPWLGSLRDQVLGIKLVNGRGELLRFGGQVMKNVAGYDVSRLQAGAMGSLGVITEVTVKVLPRPAHTVTVCVDCETGDQALAILCAMKSRPLPLTGACWLEGNLHLRLSGASDSVRAAVNELQRTHAAAEGDDDFWRALRDHELPFFQQTKPLWRRSCRANRPADNTAGAQCLDWGGAQRWLVGDTDSGSSGQSTCFRHGPRTQELFPEMSSELQALHRRLKQAFDPAGLFNPGRLYSWL